jgi:hypothetical protein
MITEELDKLCGAIDKKIEKVYSTNKMQLITTLQEIFLNPMFMFFTRNVYLRIVSSKSWKFDTV